MVAGIFTKTLTILSENALLFLEKCQPKSTNRLLELLEIILENYISSRPCACPPRAINIEPMPEFQTTPTDFVGIFNTAYAKVYTIGLPVGGQDEKVPIELLPNVVEEKFRSTTFNGIEIKEKDYLGPEYYLHI